jgi:hypothetical protein
MFVRNDCKVRSLMCSCRRALFGSHEQPAAHTSHIIVTPAFLHVRALFANDGVIIADI